MPVPLLLTYVKTLRTTFIARLDVSSALLETAFTVTFYIFREMYYDEKTVV